VAQALLRNPKNLLLDESISDLDTKGEKYVDCLSPGPAQKSKDSILDEATSALDTESEKVTKAEDSHCPGTAQKPKDSAPGRGHICPRYRE
jgi:ABC-type uncharacterized transport system fused permease/ATPase subunit